MSVFSARTLVAAAAVLSVSILSASAQPAQPSLGDVAGRRAAAPGKHLIWKVSKDGTTVAFLVGSVHVLSRDSYPLPPLFDAVYAQTKVLIEEVDLGEAADPSTAAGVAAKALLTDGQTLKSLIDAPTYQRVAEKAAKAGLPMMVLDRMKPWLVAMTLLIPELQRAGLDPTHGLDRHFYERAKTDARPVKGLETAAYQLDRLNGLSLTTQVEMLRTYLDDVENQVENVQALVTGWRSGDVAGLEKVLLKELRESPELYERLLVERNRNWVPTIAACQTTAPCLVVVGGAHLMGPESVVELLTKAGFTVEQQ